MRAGSIPAAVGRGLFAGLAGTAAITLSQAIEMKIRKREASKSPAQAAEKVLGIKPVGEQEEQRLSMLVHWGYGTAWGGIRGLLDSIGIPGLAADGVEFAAVSGAAMTMLPALELAPPVQEWGAEEIAVETFHHLVYVAVTGLVYSWLTNNSSDRS